MSVCVLALAAACGDGGEATTPTATAVPFPELTPFAEDVAAHLHDIRDRVSEVRDLPVFIESRDGVVSRDELRAYSEAASELDVDERRELEAFNVAFRMLRLIDEDDDLLELLTRSLGDDVLGLYFFDDDKLVLIGDGRNLHPGHEVTLAHEYLHSLQDGFFDLARFERLLEDENDDPESSTEYDATLACVYEGDATFGSFAWAADAFGPDWTEVVFPEREGEAPDEREDGYPEALSRYGAFNYDDCVRFIAALYGDGGWDAVNHAYLRPPSSTEQILHPEKYRSGERASRLPPPDDISRTLGEGWERLDLDVFGEFDLLTYLATQLGDEDAAQRAASGWGAGWISVYRLLRDRDADSPTPEVTQADDVLVHMTLEWDSQRDYEEFDEAFRRVADSVSGGATAGDDPRVLCWSTETEHAFYLAEPNGGHNHLILSTSKFARDAALAERIEGRLFSCPA